MLHEQVALLYLTYWHLLLPAIFVSYLLRQRYHNGLSRYPGPLFASFTDLYRLLQLWKTRGAHEWCVKLHKKHGDVVRIGPNLLSFGDPRAIKDIYGLNKGFVKASMHVILHGFMHG